MARVDSPKTSQRVNLPFSCSLAGNLLCSKPTPPSSPIFFSLDLPAHFTKAYLLLPLVAAVTYAFSALHFKRALSLGLGPWRAAFVMNVFYAIAFLPMFFWAKPVPSLWSLWPAVLAGVLLFAGSICNTLALTRGEVSVSTPIMGFKPVVVAVLSVLLLGTHLGWRIWLACFLSVTGIVLMQGRLKGISMGKLRDTVGFAVASAVTFAGYDILVQHYAPIVGRFMFAPVSYIACCALTSFLLLKGFQEPLSAVSKSAWTAILLGSGLMVLQSALLYFGIAFFQDATGNNIVHSSRGVFSVIVVWTLGHHFANTEVAQGGHALMGKRLIGAIFVTAAVIFAMT